MVLVKSGFCPLLRHHRKGDKRKVLPRLALFSCWHSTQARRHTKWVGLEETPKDLLVRLPCSERGLKTFWGIFTLSSVFLEGNFVKTKPFRLLLLSLFWVPGSAFLWTAIPASLTSPCLWYFFQVWPLSHILTNPWENSCSSPPYDIQIHAFVCTYHLSQDRFARSVDFSALRTQELRLDSNTSPG